jgi:thiamine-phosphate diphosphorylase
LREKDLSEPELLTLALKIKTASDETRGQLIINSSLTVAREVKSYGLHLPFARLKESGYQILSPEYPGLAVSVSVHSLPEALAAQKAGASQVLAGPIFPTASKPGHPGTGLKLIRLLKQNLSIPVWAVGGLKPNNIKEVIKTGAETIFIRGPLMEEPDPEGYVQKCLEEIS